MHDEIELEISFRFIFCLDAVKSLNRIIFTKKLVVYARSEWNLLSEIRVKYIPKECKKAVKGTYYLQKIVVSIQLLRVKRFKSYAHVSSQSLGNCKQLQSAENLI